MAFRSDEQALRESLRQLERATSDARSTEQRFRDELEQELELLRQAEERLAEAGPGGGLKRGAVRDRVHVAALVLLLIGVPTLIFQVLWHEYIDNDPSIIPAILWLGTPTLLALIIAWPYRSRGGRFVVLICEVCLWPGVGGVLWSLLRPVGCP